MLTTLVQLTTYKSVVFNNCLVLNSAIQLLLYYKKAKNFACKHSFGAAECPFSIKIKVERDFQYHRTIPGVRGGEWRRQNER